MNVNMAVKHSGIGKKRVMDKLNYIYDNFLLLYLYIERNYKYFIITLILISIVIKVGLYLFYDIPQPPDARKYINILDHYREKHGLETNLELNLSIILISPYMKLYPTFLYLTGATLASIIQIILSSITIFFIFKITEIVTAKLSVSIIASILFCFNPFLTYYSLLMQYETMFLFFFLWAIYNLLTNRIYISYFIFIITIFINPVVEIGIILFIFLSSIIYFNNSLSKSFKNVIIFLIIYGVFSLSNIIHNYNALGMFERFYVHSILPLENNKVYAEHGLDFEKIHNYFEPIVEKNCPENEIQKNDIIYQLIDKRLCQNKTLNKHAIDYIKNPDNYSQLIKNFFSRAQRLFSFYPYDTEEFHVKVISSIYYSILYLFTLLFFFNFKSLKIKEFYPIFIILISSFGVYLLLHAVFRYRVPFDNFLIILASYSIVNFLNYSRKKIKKRL